ncbi:hypothetical protein F4779DRAFT_111457 [Xylariaceae sp. FL0662B]|nr:hypothetical protein F4779DRAFT_111457 [Xylariaceae sp. FL0662B]
MPHSNTIEAHNPTNLIGDVVLKGQLQLGKDLQLRHGCKKGPLFMSQALEPPVVSKVIYVHMYEAPGSLRYAVGSSVPGGIHASPQHAPTNMQDRCIMTILWVSNASSIPWRRLTDWRFNEYLALQHGPQHCQRRIRWPRAGYLNLVYHCCSHSTGPILLALMFIGPTVIGVWG